MAGDPFIQSRVSAIVARAAEARIPAMYFDRTFVEAGGLISYGPNQLVAYRDAGDYVGRILSGEKPGDLPVIQPLRFETVLNLKTARALSLNIPDLVLALTDEVIE